MIRRILSLLVLIWLFGFVWFAIALPRPASPSKADAVVVYTGGEGRIDRGLEALRKGWAPRMLVSGVDRDVRPREFEAEYGVSRKLMNCCVTLGFQSYDTRSNAVETAEWLIHHDVRSVRLVTTDWHMRRAAEELDRAKPDQVTVVRDAVKSEPSFKILFLEYHKWLARYLLRVWETLR